MDSGADRTVFDAATLAPLHSQEQVGGLGRVTDAVLVDTQVRLTEASE